MGEDAELLLDEAYNGYIEVFLNLGSMGIALLAVQARLQRMKK